MGLGSVWSGLGSASDEPKEVSGEFCKDAEQLTDCGRLSDDPSGQTTLEVSENVGAIDAIVLSCLDVEVLPGGTEYGEGVEVVAEHLGTEILLGSEPGDPGELFEVEAVLDPLEGFFDPPSAVIQIREILSRECRGIEQGGH